MASASSVCSFGNALGDFDRSRARGEVEVDSITVSLTHKSQGGQVELFVIAILKWELSSVVLRNALLACRGARGALLLERCNAPQARRTTKAPG